MAFYADRDRGPATLKQMACGGVPVFDDQTGYAYRCDQCFAVIGSVGQPRSCQEMNKAASSPSEKEL